MFLSLSISFKYLPKYNKRISYIYSFPLIVCFISFISKEEKGKNKTSLSFGKKDIFSISPCVHKLYSILVSFSNINKTLDKLLFLF